MNVIEKPLAVRAEESSPRSPELQALLAAAARGHPGRVAGARTLLGGLRRLTLLAAEEWLAVLHAAVVEIRRRLVTLKMEAARIRDVAAGDAAGRVVLWQRRYSTLLCNVTSDLQMLLQVPLPLFRYVLRYGLCLCRLAAQALLQKI